MKELIERIECATGPSRELDLLIEAATNPQYAGAGEKTLDFLSRYGRHPKYTASPDAAMTLVPEGWNWMAGERNQGRCRAYVNNGELQFAGIGASRRNPNAIWHEVVAATPALALAAAALKARGE